MDAIGEVKFVLFKKVSFIQRFLNAILIHFGTYTYVLYVEGVLKFRGVFLEGFYCIQKHLFIQFFTHENFMVNSK